jgi:hypothetical protein
MKKTTLLTLIFIFTAFKAYAQEDIPEKQITISFGRITKYEALTRIGSELGVTISYKEGLIRNNEMVCVDYLNTPLSKVIADIFGDIEIQCICDEEILVIRPKEKPYGFKKDDSLPVMKIEMQEIYSADDRLPALEKITSREIGIVASDFSFNNASDSSDQDAENISGSETTYSSGSDRFLRANGFINVGNSHGRTKGLRVPVNVRIDRRPEIILNDENCYDLNGPGGTCDMGKKRIFLNTGLTISPHIVFADNGKVSTSIHGGLSQAVWYKHEVGFYSGIQFSSQQVRLNSEDEGADTVGHLTTINYYIVPTCLLYTVYATRQSRYYVSGGIIHYFFSNRSLPILYADTHYEWVQYVNLSLGYEKAWFSNFSVSIEPFYLFPLGEHDQFRLLSKFGITLSINYTYR